MQKNQILSTFQITLPLRSVQLTEKFILSPENYELHLEMQPNILFTNTPIALYPRNMEISSSSVILSDFISMSLKQTQIENSNQANDILFVKENDVREQNMLVFRNYQSYIDQNNLHFTLMNNEIILTLEKVQKPKFVKNEYLDLLLSPNEDIPEYGLLSMDQLGRIMVEDQDCQYPAIGIWYKSEQLSHVLVYARICQFLHKKAKNKQKCKFKFGRKHYIYFVHIPSDKNIPELYVVSWEKPDQKEQKHFKKVIRKNQTIKINFQQENEEDEVEENLQFTLRNRDESLTPVKLIEDLQFGEKLESIEFPNSPVFSSMKKPFFSNEDCFNCQKLMEKVGSQEEEILTLQTEVKKLNLQLNRLRQCFSASPSKKPFLLIKSPLYNVEDSAPRTNLKKLTESDLRMSNLKLNSASTRQKKSSFENSSEKSHSKKMKGFFMDQDDPWDNMQIIE